jgi:hypothetical protein
MLHLAVQWHIEPQNSENETDHPIMYCSAWNEARKITEQAKATLTCNNDK